MAKIDKKILIVEDDVNQRQALSLKLSVAGFNVLESTNGEEGLETALRVHPDLILLDIVMPKMDGLTVLKNIRKDEWGKNAKVILLTNVSDAVSVADAMEHRTYDYLVKSDWDIEDVVAKIHEQLGEEPTR